MNNQALSQKMMQNMLFTDRADPAPPFINKTGRPVQVLCAMIAMVYSKHDFITPRKVICDKSGELQHRLFGITFSLMRCM